MELPSVVRRALGDAAVQVVLNEDAQNTDETRLRTVFLRDEKGAIQVISRRRDILDIAALNQRLQRDLRPLPAAEQLHLCRQAGLAELPALPGVTKLPTFVDVAVDALSTIAIELSDIKRVLLMQGSDFKTVTAAVERFEFAVALDTVFSDDGQSPEQDTAQLHTTLKRFTSLRIRQRLDDTLELPPLSQTAQRIIQLRVNPNAVMGDLVDIVEKDPSLAAQVVSWASSSFYAAGGQVRSLQDAISRVLGFDLVMNLAMGLSLGRALNLPEDHPDGYVSYWQQAIWQAQSASLLTRLMPREKRPASGLAYLAGLLHNFGSLVLAHVFPPHFKLMCRSLEVNHHVDASVIEQHLLGITRELIASQLMTNWGMPDEITLAIRHQKNPAYGDQHAVYARLIWLGRQLLAERGVALGVGEPVADSCYLELGLDRATVAEKFDDLISKGDSVLAMASMIQTGK